MTADSTKIVWSPKKQTALSNGRLLWTAFACDRRCHCAFAGTSSSLMNCVCKSRSQCKSVVGQGCQVLNTRNTLSERRWVEQGVSVTDRTVWIVEDHWALLKIRCFLIQLANVTNPSHYSHARSITLFLVCPPSHRCSLSREDHVWRHFSNITSANGVVNRSSKQDRVAAQR